MGLEELLLVALAPETVVLEEQVVVDSPATPVTPAHHPQDYLKLFPAAQVAVEETQVI